MDMDGMDMSMGNTSMGDGIPSLFTLQKMYWAVVGAAVGAFTLVNLYSWLLYYQRYCLIPFMSSNPPRLTKYRINSCSVTPAKPNSAVVVALATTTAIFREVGNTAAPVLSIRRCRLPSPTLGRTLIVLANAVVLLVLCFYKLDVNDRWSFEDIGYRTGFITICQLPLLFLLAGKRNIIGYLTGSSYERINWLHRWASRCLLLTATIHMGYWFADWAPYDYIGKKVRTDPITKHGVIAWSILLWITISSMTPIRGWCYEFFVIQHIISFAAFIGMVYLHTPLEVRFWIWICVGIFFFDRAVRGFFYLYNNLAILHPRQRRNGAMGRIWALKAELIPVSNSTTRLVIKDPPISWSPGQHVFLSSRAVGPVQAHPFTIASLPSDGKMEFLIQARGGGTRKLHHHVEKMGLSLPHTMPELNQKNTSSVVVEGPYGFIRPLEQFDTVVLLAGSTGATFTLPLLRHLVEGWKRDSSKTRSNRTRVVTRRARFVWIVKSGKQLDWFSRELTQVVEDVELLRSKGQEVDVDISAYITCDETFTTEQKGILDRLSSARTPSNGVYGRVSQVMQPEDDLYTDNKEGGVHKEKVDVRELVTPRLSSENIGESSKQYCGPSGTCCCTTIIKDENDGHKSQPACTCNCGTSSSRTDSSASSNFDMEPKKPLLHHNVSIFSGRPHCRSVVRKALEQALGESAVVVCGPAGLVDDVRASTVSLSDERGVHKGTGAQGIWLHAEAFGY